MSRLLKMSLLLNGLVLAVFIFALLKIGSPRYLYHLIKYRGQGIVSLKKHRTSHLSRLPKSEGKIIMLGNSITAEAEWSELLQNPDILNRGIIGDGTADILARLPDITAYQPRKVFLLIGVNDLMFIPIDKILENYEQIVSKIVQDSPKTELYLESVLPIHNDLRRNGMKNSDILALNKGIERLAQKFGVTYIDLHAKFCSTEGSLKENFSMDGIHLNADGYAQMAEVLKPFVSEPIQ